MIEIKKFVFSEFFENTYVLVDKSSNKAIIVDPGCREETEKQELLDFIKSNNLFVEYILNTHCHLDHIFGNNALQKETGSKLIYHKDDEFLLKIQLEYSLSLGLLMEPSPLADKYLLDDETLVLGNSTFSVIHTPGHSPGGICLYSKENDLCITGDTIFNESIGRSDLWNGDHFQLIDSINAKIMSLPENTILYPGHGEKTSVEYEKNNNPFL